MCSAISPDRGHGAAMRKAKHFLRAARSPVAGADAPDQPLLGVVHDEPALGSGPPASGVRARTRRRRRAGQGGRAHARHHPHVATTYGLSVTSIPTLLKGDPSVHDIGHRRTIVGLHRPLNSGPPSPAPGRAPSSGWWGRHPPRGAGDEVRCSVRGRRRVAAVQGAPGAPWDGGSISVPSASIRNEAVVSASEPVAPDHRSARGPRHLVHHLSAGVSPLPYRDSDPCAKSMTAEKKDI